MKVIIIDNNDSFTYNLFHYVNTFIDNVDVFRANKINIVYPDMNKDHIMREYYTYI